MSDRTLPSIVDVAARAGVSIATVSRVLNGRAAGASSATAERVREAAASLGYRPDSVGRALRQRRSRLVAVLAANLANPAMTATAASIEVALRQRGLVMVLCDTHDRPELQDEYLLEMRAQLACATVLLGAVDSPQLSAMLAAGEPLLFVNRRSPDGRDRSYLGIDNAQAGRDVARLFLSQDVRVAGVIHGSLRSSATAERVEAFRAELARGGQALHDHQLMTADMLDHMRIGHHCARTLGRGRGRRGLFCLSDLIAYGAHRALLEAGLRVPEDVLLVGFDDTPLNEWLAPWLSSVRVPYEAFGPAIVGMLDQDAQSGSAASRLLPHRLITRSE